MGKVQDYLKSKEESLWPTGYCFYSDREGVSVIHEVKYETINNRHKFKDPIYGYIRSVEISDVFREELYGSGFGDLWEGSFLFSTDKFKINGYHDLEKSAIERKYFSSYDWKNITDSIHVKNLIIQKLTIEREIKEIDENALINLELYLLSL